MRTRQAQLRDAHSIHQLIDSFSHDGTLLRRSYTEICVNILTFTIVETDDHTFLGCAALHVYGPHLAEVRSIVVRPDIKGHGAGGLLIQAVLHRAEASGIKCVCLFTRVPAFFAHFNFHVVQRHLSATRYKRTASTAPAAVPVTKLLWPSATSRHRKTCPQRLSFYHNITQTLSNFSSDR